MCTTTFRCSWIDSKKRFIRSLPIGLIIFIFCLQAQSQGVTIETETVPVMYYSMPENPLDPEFATYTAAIILPGSELAPTGLNEHELLSKYVVLDGYKRVLTKGDVDITVTIKALNIIGEKIDSRKTTSIDKEGNKITKHEFFMELQYAVPVSYKITDRNGIVLIEKSVSDLNMKKSFKTDYFSTERDLDSYWRINKPTKMVEWQRAFILEGLATIYEQVSRQYGFKIIKDEVRFETNGKKKHAEYDTYNAHLQLIKKDFMSMAADKSVEEIRTSIQLSLEFYENASKKYATGDKEEGKLKHICLYNLALANFWLEDFEQAESFAKEILSIDSKDKDALKLVAEIEKTKEALARANKPSRHQVIVGEKT